MREEKQFLKDEIKDHLDSSEAFVLARYHDMNPNTGSDFRQLLTDKGGVFQVIKKRIFMKVAEDAGIDLNSTDLEGHIGLIYAKKDPVAVTKALYDFQKEHKGLFTFLGGQFEGRLCTENDLQKIAELPSKEEMQAQLLGTFEAPLSQTLAVVEALLTSVMHCLENKSKQDS